MKALWAKIDNGLYLALTKASDVCDAIRELWRSLLPKWLRFIIFYITMPIWIPLVIVIWVVLASIYYPIDGMINAWRKFK